MKFATQWLSEGCMEEDGWCGDRLHLDSRSTHARKVFADCWLDVDDDPPVPNRPNGIPSRTRSGPRKLHGRQRAIDGWGWPVEYKFESTNGGGHPAVGVRNGGIVTAS
jgi:hypothetical protein